MSQLMFVLAYVIFVANIYVAALYYKAPPGDRDSPTVIKSRILRVSILTLILTLSAPYVLTNLLKVTPDKKTARNILGFTGFFEYNTIVKMFKTLILFVMLFVGPIIQHIVESDLALDLHNGYLGLLRDVVVAPITEEVVYTSLSLAPFLAYMTNESHKYGSEWPPLTAFSNDTSISKLLLLTPLFFGSAHLHHFHSMITRKDPKPLPVVTTLIIVMFQFAYTSIFGYLTNRIFISTGTVWACIVAHSFCNWISFPALDVGAHYSIGFRIGYWLLLILGVWSFCSYFYILSE